MIIGAQGYTFRELTSTKEEVATGLKKVKDIGYESVQISGFSYYDPDFIAGTAKELGLDICVTHTPLKRIIEDTDAVIREHKLFGAKYVGLGYASHTSLDETKDFLKSIDGALKKLAGEGLKFVYHNHHNEFRKFAGVTPTAYMLEHTSPDEFGLLVDCYWLQYGGLSPVRFLNDNKERIELVHLKDMCIKPDNSLTFCEVFEGNMDYESIISACLINDVKYAIVEQDICQCDPFESLEISYKNIQRFLKSKI